MRKIAVCGKGGSGKSVTVTLLASGIRDRHVKVLVVDADESNTGLHRLLGFDKTPEPLIGLMGGKQKVEEELTARIAAGESELSVELMQDEIVIPDIPPQYILERNGIGLISVGKILMALEGCACPMGVVSRSFLKKLRLGADEAAVIDLEAGVEHFGRGVETSVDAVLVVVEPSIDSLEVAERIYELSTGLNIGDVWAVLNKVPSDEIAARLTQRLYRRGIPVIGTVHHDTSIFEECLEGQPLRGVAARQDIEGVLEFIFP
jgi:CO dehydrogenase maturation factor